MKMAKASEIDVETAMELCLALESLIAKFNPLVPEKIEVTDCVDAGEDFDIDNPEQCRRVLSYLLDLANRASLMRVVWGMAVLLDPKNKMINPDADTLEHHPDTVRAFAFAEKHPGYVSALALALPVAG